MKTLLVVLGLVLGIAHVRAQTADGVIDGVVKDDSGALIGGARVKLIDESTSQAREQRTTLEGSFAFRVVPFGNYTLEAEQPNFKKQQITHITLQVAQARSFDIVLRLGDVTESISVQASAGLLQSSDASLSQVMAVPS